MALNVGQLLAPPDGSLVGAVKQGTGVTIDGDGTISISGGGDFPLTTINFPTTIPGTANTTWADNSSLIYATGCIEFSINGGAFGQGARVIDTGDVLTTQWLTTPACGGAPHGTTIIGTITDSTYSESSTFTIDRVPNAFLFGDLTEQPLSSVVTSNPLIPSGFNTTTYVTLNAGNTLTSVQASAGGGAFTAIPASGTTLPLNPGQSLQIRGTTGGANNTTYSATVNLGVTGNVVSDAWDVTTVTVAASIAQPSILTPPSGTTGLNPALNSPAGITLTASAYAPLNGAGAQTSSQWEVYNGGYPVGPSTGTISAVNPGSSGTPGTIRYKTSNSADTNPNSQNEVYGKLATDQFNDSVHPMFQWVKGLNIGGFSDWYIPAKNELEILYYNLKPDTTINNTASGINPNAVPARGSNYTVGVPSQTSAILFRSGNAQAFSTANFYWPSTEYSSDTTYAWSQGFSGGAQFFNLKILRAYARAIRRIPINDYVAAGSPAIGTPLAGGFYGGQISTAGNSIADYALIVAPNAQGTYGYTGGTNTSLSIAGADTGGFQVGLTIKGDTSGATGIILAIDSTTIQYLPTSGTFITGETISTDPASYSPITGSPFTDTSAPFDTLFIPQSSLATSTNYFARVQYATTNTQAATSPFSAWSSFGTAASFVLTPGTPYGGGYFAGQINVSGTIYNLIVAPITGTGGQQGQFGGITPLGIRYKTSNTGDGGATQDEAYGGLATTSFADANHPMFDWCVNGANGPRSNGGIGGFTDWYIPAKNELAVLYFFLKPDSTANNTSSGSNPNSVAPYTPNTNYGPGFPNISSSALFAGGAQAFSTASYYWSSTEFSSVTINAWYQNFSNGSQFISNKSLLQYARAIRRVPA